MPAATDTDPLSLLASLIGPACHELRSPLAVVFGFAKMLERDELPEPARTYVTQIVGGTQRLDELLDALSRVGRIAAGRAVPSHQVVQLRAIVDDLETTSAYAQRISVDAGGSVDVQADPQWLADAFHGIIDALCFDEQLRLRLSWAVGRDVVEVSFEPQGSFPLVETDPAKAGLGISLARMRLMAMGGALEGDDDRVVASVPLAVK